MTTPQVQTTTLNESEAEAQNTIPFEGAVQRVLNWVIDRIPVANNNEREWIKAHVDALYESAVESNTVSGVGTSGNLSGTAAPGVTAVPVETVPPVQTSPVPTVTPMGGNATQVNDGVVQAETTDSVPVDANSVSFPESYPVNGSPEDIRNWYANASDSDIEQVNAARAAQA